MEPGVGCKECICNRWRLHGFICLSKPFTNLYGPHRKSRRLCSKRIKKRKPLNDFMKTKLTLSILVIAALFFSFTNKKNPKVLIFCKTGVYYHKSIPVGIEAIKKLGAENKFDVDTTTDSLRFNDK